MQITAAFLPGLVAGLLFARPAGLYGQAGPCPFLQAFDSAAPPSLPSGWVSSRSRFPSSRDFTVTDRATRSGRGAVCAEDATVEQWLISPPYPLDGRLPAALSFQLRRSASFGAPIVVHLSTDGGETFRVNVGDTLQPEGTAGYVYHRLVVPPIRPGTNSVVFRWKTVASAFGRAGSLRLDDISLETTDSLDGCAGSLSVPPAVLSAGSRAQVRCLVRNRGFVPFPEGSVQFVQRYGPGPCRQFGSVPVPAGLGPGDSASVGCLVDVRAPGSMMLEATLFLPGERDTADNRAYLKISAGSPRGTIVVNEIMYAPVGNEPEWVELCNTSGDTLDLSGWGVTDRGSVSRRLFPERELVIPPGGFRVCTKDSSAFAAVHPSVVQDVVPVPGFPSLNNAGDELVIWDVEGREMDSLSYLPHWGGESGRSLERILAAGPTNVATNWATSRSTEGSTPGRNNSRSRKRVDLSIDSVSVSPAGGSGHRLGATICNPGLTGWPSFSMLVRRGEVPSIAPPLAETPWLNGPDTLSCLPVFLDLPAADPGLVRYTAVINVPGDEDTTNNSACVLTGVPYAYGSIRINEIMFAPLPGGTEYVELVNTGNSPIRLDGWRITRRPGGGSLERAIPLDDAGPHLVPGGFAVVAADSMIIPWFAGTLLPNGLPLLVAGNRLVLSNDGDEVLLVDPSGRTVDSVWYDPSWHTPWVDDPTGRSLEKIRPELPSADGRNWGTCARSEGGTPGRTNSILLPAPGTGIQVSIVPNPFSPDGDGHDDRTIVHYELPAPGTTVSVKIFDVRGRLVRRLADEEPGGTSMDIVWDGLDEDRRPAPIGMYVVFLESVVPGSGDVTAEKRVVVLARAL